MFLPNAKEREYRFKLALRMGLPIFALIISFISHTFINSYEALPPIFYIEAILLLAFSIYYIFYLIYNGFNERIIDEVSKTFTREYLYDYLRKELKKESEYSLVLVSINNLNDINTTYGIKNGDKVLSKVALWIEEYFSDKEIKNFPIGHIKGGDFILGLKGDKTKYKIILELLSLKVEEFKVDGMEVQIISTITDTNFSKELDYMIEHLFELQGDIKLVTKEDQLDPNELDSSVIHAIKKRKFLVSTQDVFENGKSVIKECFIKLESASGKILFPKSYMKVINRLGLMVDFDLMVVEKSIKSCMEIENSIFAITVSPTSLRNSHFLTKLKELLENYPNVINKIMFILSEAEYYSHANKYNNILKTVREMGILITIDRLGSVHTSFLYLRDLEIDAIRFDSYYAKDTKNRDIVEGFNLMAHKKGIKTWVKKIEDEEIELFAKEIGVDYLQGIYLAPLEIRQY
jgi:EAL domain-containing protein (putative c-di-GMP-specific phosphodiesterase class I)/GGDEF domain-containing protein